MRQKQCATLVSVNTLFFCFLSYNNPHQFEVGVELFFHFSFSYSMYTVINGTFTFNFLTLQRRPIKTRLNTNTINNIIVFSIFLFNLKTFMELAILYTIFPFHSTVKKLTVMKKITFTTSYYLVKCVIISACICHALYFKIIIF